MIAIESFGKMPRPKGGCMKVVAQILFILLLAPGCALAQLQDETVFKDPASSFEVDVLVYKPYGWVKDVGRTVVIYPPTGGVTRLERSYAKQFAKRGATAIVLTNWTGLSESTLELSIHQTLHERAMKAFEVTMLNIPDTHSISVLGTSVGGIFTSLIAAMFDRPDRYLIIGAGAPVAEVISQSDQSDLAKARDQRYEKYGFSTEAEYAEELSKVFNLEPTEMSKPAEGVRLGAFVLTEDTTVPTHHQYKLAEHWQAQVWEIEASHVWGIFRAWWSYSDEIADFLIED